MDSNSSSKFVGTSIRDFNTRLMLSALFVGTWFSVRDHFPWQSSGTSVLVEWLASLVVVAWIVLQRLPTLSSAFSPVVGMLVLSYLMVSAWRREDLGKWSVYWRGFGPRVTLTALGGAILITILVVSANRAEPKRPLVTRLSGPTVSVFIHWVTALAGLWMLPTILQPMDAWLNIGDSTAKVLDELTGPMVGNFPGFNQAAGYSTLLGVPLLPLNFVAGHGQWKLVLLVLWVNGLCIGVPLLMAAIMRKFYRAMPYSLALVIALVPVTVSGSQDGNSHSQFFLNTSLFRELSFLARLAFPLLLGYLVASTFAYGTTSRRRIFLLALLSALGIVNNPEFGISSAIAVLIVLMSHSRGSAASFRTFRLYMAIISLFGVPLAVGGAIHGGDWIGRRLGLFQEVISGEGSVLSGGLSGQIPSMGVVAVIFSVSIAAVAVAIRTIRFDQMSKSLSAASTVLYFGLWVLLSSPYVLNAGASGAFGAQFYLVPLTIISVGLFYLLVVSVPMSSGSSPIGSQKRGLLKFERASQLPVMFLLALVVAAGLSTPNGVKEWRRVQQPVSNQKWTDEWSVEKLDYIQPSEIVDLASRAGGVSQVGWWGEHGNAIELLTGVENLFGTSVVEAAVRGREIRGQACETVTRSSLRYLISELRLLPILRGCEGVSLRSVSRANHGGLILVKLNRD